MSTSSTTMSGRLNKSGKDLGIKFVQFALFFLSILLHGCDQLTIFTIFLHAQFYF